MSAITDCKADQEAYRQAPIRQSALHAGCAVACGDQVLATVQHVMCEPVCRVTVHLRAVIC